jgi:hypothetical protein
VNLEETQAYSCLSGIRQASEFQLDTASSSGWYLGWDEYLTLHIHISCRPKTTLGVAPHPLRDQVVQLLLPRYLSVGRLQTLHTLPHSFSHARLLSRVN